MLVSFLTLGLVSALGWREDIGHEFRALILLFAATGAMAVGTWFRDRFRWDETEKTLRERDTRHGAAVHSYRRMMKVMEAASEELLTREELPPSLREQGERHVEMLRSIAREQDIELTKIASLGRRPAQTHVHSVDMMMSYMQKLAAAQETDLQLRVHGSLSDLCAAFREEDIRTLLSDLVENALIAVKEREAGRVLADITADMEPYQIDVYDNGRPFPAEIAARMGREPVTGRRMEGGSGQGLMTVLRLCRAHGASFELEEFEGNLSFTKRVSLCFDGLGQTRIKSARAEIARAVEEREDVLLI